MSSERWTTGLIAVTTASQIVIGTASCDWKNQLAAGHVIKVDDDNENTYKIATILTATRLLLSANYAESRGSFVFYPGVSGDDGQVILSSQTFGTNYTEAFVGAGSGGSDAFIRFPNVTVPKDSIVSSAFLLVNCHYGDTDVTWRSKIHIVQADDQAAPTNYAEYIAMSLDS
ncbi:MAG: hypothetical protein ABIG69_19355, partial [Bacteroidota bacterium]